MEMKTTLKLCISCFSGTQGVFIATREEGDQGPGPGPKRGRGRGRTAAETRPRPRFRGHTGAARAVLRVTRGPVCSLSVPVPGSVLQALVVAELAL